MTAMLGGVPGSSLSSGQLDLMTNLQLWQPWALAFCLSLWLLPLPRSKVGLILFYLHLSLHLLTALLSLGGNSFLTQTPILHQLFAVGPGFSPVPAKLVSQIVAGEFVELNELLNELEPQLRFDGWLVLTSTPKKAQVGGWWHNQLVRSFFSALPYFILPFLASLERFPALSPAYPPDSLPVRWSGLVSVRLGFLWTCCCNEPHRLVNH